VSRWDSEKSDTGTAAATVTGETSPWHWQLEVQVESHYKLELQDAIIDDHHPMITAFKFALCSESESEPHRHCGRGGRGRAAAAATPASDNNDHDDHHRDRLPVPR
jgi:hypothetical protein